MEENQENPTPVESSAAEAEAPKEAPVEAPVEAAAVEEKPAEVPASAPPQQQQKREDRPPRPERQGQQGQPRGERGPKPERGGERGPRPERGGPGGGDRGPRGERGDRGGRPQGGGREGGRPGGERRGFGFEPMADIDIEKLISDSLYLDNQAHAVVARMRDMDSGTKSQLRRLFNAVRRAVRAPESDRQHQFVMLRARLAYTIARHSLRSLDGLERLLLQVTRKNDVKGYERFKDLFEAIVAYNE